MSFRATPGRLEVWDGAVKTYDSDSLQFVGATALRTGTLPFAATNSSGFWTYDLGAVPAGADIVVGAFRVTFPGTSDPSGTPGYGWMCAGGDYVHAAATGPNFQGYFPYFNDRIVTHNFYVDSGHLWHTRLIANPVVNLAGGSTYQVTYNAYNIEYKIIVGKFVD